jgi:hypothetical protein
MDFLYISLCISICRNIKYFSVYFYTCYFSIYFYLCSCENKEKTSSSLGYGLSLYWIFLYILLYYTGSLPSHTRMLSMYHMHSQPKKTNNKNVTTYLLSLYLGTHTRMFNGLAIAGVPCLSPNPLISLYIGSLATHTRMFNGLAIGVQAGCLCLLHCQQVMESDAGLGFRV